MEKKIKDKIAMYKVAIEGLNDQVITDWHKKQINSINDKIQELEWVLKNGVDNSTYDSGMPEISQYLEMCEIYQKDGAGIYFYISDNGKHGINLIALLEDFKRYLIGLNEVKKSKKE